MAGDGQKQTSNPTPAPMISSSFVARSHGRVPRNPRPQRSSGSIGACTAVNRGTMPLSTSLFASSRSGVLQASGSLVQDGTNADSHAAHPNHRMDDPLGTIRRWSKRDEASTMMTILVDI